MRVIIIGGGAAGFFSAVEVAKNYPKSSVLILEKSEKILSKVKISGGGRCNVTNNCFDIQELSKNYPRGEKFIKQLFKIFQPKDVFKWFESKGVKLVAENDGRVFPISNNSQSIIDCFISETKKNNIEVYLKQHVIKVNVSRNGDLSIETAAGIIYKADKIIVTTGGSNKMESYKWLHDLGHSIQPPIPSLFTLNIPNNNITQLMGVSVPNIQVKILSTKFVSEGPILITHWGFSGPSILKLSAFAAEYFFQKNYHLPISINWLNLTEHALRVWLQQNYLTFATRKVFNKNPFNIPQRLWEHLLSKTQIDENLFWQNLSKKDVNKIINTLTNDVYQVQGKTTFKEEFVTCGGVSLKDINASTLESNYCQGLFFAGEVLNIDAITGGYNFQAAWTTAFIAAKLGN